MANQMIQTRRVYRFYEIGGNMPDYATRHRTVTELETLFERLCRDFGQRILIFFPRSKKDFPYSYMAVDDGIPGIVIAPHQRQITTVLHEFAHLLEPEDRAHGPRFMQRYLDLMAKYGRCDRELLELTAASFGIEL